MNRSIIITRYARSLVKLVLETGNGAVVSSEAETLVQSIRQMSDLKRMVTAADDVVSPFEKKKLLQGALGNRMSPELSRFLTLLNQNGRMELVEEILRDFVNMYYRGNGVRRAHLTSVSEPSERLLQRLKDLVRQKTGDDVFIEVDVDPFVFDLDEYLLDASVKHQLDQIREQFVERNRRII